MSRSLKRQQEIESSIDVVGLDEFKMYASPKGMIIKESTYGVKKIVHNGKAFYREVVEAIRIGPDNRRTFGWIINFFGKRRKAFKFVNKKQKYYII